MSIIDFLRFSLVVLIFFLWFSSTLSDRLDYYHVFNFNFHFCLLYRPFSERSIYRGMDTISEFFELITDELFERVSSFLSFLSHFLHGYILKSLLNIHVFNFLSCSSYVDSWKPPPCQLCRRSDLVRSPEVTLVKFTSRRSSPTR